MSQREHDRRLMDYGRAVKRDAPLPDEPRQYDEGRIARQVAEAMRQEDEAEADE